MLAPENGFTYSAAVIVQVRFVAAGAALQIKPAAVTPWALAARRMGRFVSVHPRQRQTYFTVRAQVRLRWRRVTRAPGAEGILRVAVLRLPPCGQLFRDDGLDAA